MPTTFTLDTNCIIAVDEGRPEAAFINELVLAHNEGIASVGLVAMSASERQQDGRYIRNIEEFNQRLKRLGLDSLKVLMPMAYSDITFMNNSLSCDYAMHVREKSFHDVLFPSIAFVGSDYCVANGLEPNTAHVDRKWRNAKCDVQAFWTHAHNRRDVFVTSDKNFHTQTKKAALLALAGGRIETPETAVALLGSQ
jgi:hypothetical protein